MARRGTSLSRGGSEPIPRAVIDACAAIDDARTLRLALREPLRRFVPFDGYCINTADPTTALVTSSVGDGLAPRDAARLFAIEAAGADVSLLRDLARTRTITILSHTTAGKLERSRRMRTIFLPLGWHDELRAPLVIDECCWGFLHLFRARARFTERDAARVAAVVPILAGALRCAVAHAAGATAPIGPSVVTIDRRARASIAGGDAGVRALDLDGNQPVPHGLFAVAERAHRTARSTTTVARSTDGRWLALSGLGGPRLTAVIDDASSARLETTLLLAHALTPRQRDVARLVLRGDTNADVARALEISLYTAKDHVKRVFAKTRTSSRAELAAKLGQASTGT